MDKIDAPPSETALQRLMNQRLRRLVAGSEALQGEIASTAGASSTETTCRRSTGASMAATGTEQGTMRPVEKPDYELRKRYAREACQTIDAMPSPPMDAIAVSPAMAELWQELQFDEFQRAVHIKRLRGIDRVAWTKACTRTVKDVKDYAKELVALEAKIVKSQSAFGKHLGALQDLRELDYIPSVWDLPYLLQEISADRHPTAALVWIGWSRGIEMVEAGTDVPKTDVDNYEPATERLRQQAPAEVQRHVDAGYAMPWEDARAVFNIADEQPNNVLPLNIREKNEERCRMTLDPTNPGDQDVTPLNECIDKPPCKLPVFESLAGSTRRGSKLWRADYKDAFLNHNNRPSSMTHAAFRDYDGKLYTLVRMGLGFRHSSAVQQRTTTAVLRIHYRHLQKRGLHCASAMPEYDRPAQAVSPGRGHEMSVALGYSDDVGATCTTWAAAWFAFLHWLIINMHAGMELGFAPGKTDPPALEMIWIGFFISTTAMKWGLPIDWLLSLRSTLAPWASGEQKKMTLRQADEVLGSLQHASRVVTLGRGYFSELQTIKTKLGRNRHPSREFRTSVGVRAMLTMWTVLLETMALTSAFIPCRRPVFPHVGFSDASFDIDRGWCWAIMGVVQVGRWPSEWKDRIGRGSQYEEVWITELEIWVCLYMLRTVAPRAAHSTLRIKCDNMGVVYIINKLSTRSQRISPIVTELLWLCAAYNIVLEPSHVRSERNVLCDYGTRQKDKNFQAHLAAFIEVHHEQWFAEQLGRHPSRTPRPELIDKIPRAEERQYVVQGVDQGELERVQERIAAADLERAAKLQQALGTKSC